MAGIDEKSKKLLDQVKKGKDRKFVLIIKGASVKKLIIFKEGSFSGHIQNAKKEGYKGNAYWGEALCRGTTVAFQMTRADGFDRPPGKEKILKTFILEETQLKVMPAYVIVDGKPDKDGEKKVDAQLKVISSSLTKLKGSLGAAIAQDPTSKQTIMKHVTDLQKAIKAKDADTAQKTFNELKAML